MVSYLIVIASAAGLSMIFSKWFSKLGDRTRLLDHPDNDRHIHAVPVPRSGGLAIYLTFLMIILGCKMIAHPWLVPIKGSLSNVEPFFLVVTLILLVGMVDDFRRLNARSKFFFEALIAILAYFLGFRIETLQLPFIETIHLGVLSLPFTMLWIVGVANAFNIIDGLDGLSAGVALISTLAILTTAILNQAWFVLAVGAILIGALLGFLRYNFTPARLFMGDAGSLFVGGLLALLSIQAVKTESGGIWLATPVVAFALPIGETLLTMVRRLLTGHSIFSGDRRHVHHRLIEMGLTVKQAVLGLYGFTAFCALLSLLFLPTSNLYTILGFIILLSFLFVAIKFLGYWEFEEVFHLIKKGIGQWGRVSTRMHLRQLIHKLQNATNFLDIQETLCELAETARFEAFCLRLNRKKYPQLQIEDNELFYKNNGYYRWDWSRDDEVISLKEINRDCWSIRFPLSNSREMPTGDLILYRNDHLDTVNLDIDLMRKYFCPELVRAMERVCKERSVVYHLVESSINSKKRSPVRAGQNLKIKET